MKKRIVKIISICVVLVLAFLYAYVDKNEYLYDRNADTSVFISTGVLNEEEEVSQTFLAKDDTIDGINLKVSVVGDVDKVVLNCIIEDNATGDVEEMTIAGKELKNNKFNKLDFPRMFNTQGKQYTLTVRAKNCDEQNGVSLYIDPTCVNGDSLCVKGNETQGTLIARVISHRFDVETFVVLLGILGFIAMFLKVLYKLFK